MLASLTRWPFESRTTTTTYTVALASVSLFYVLWKRRSSRRAKGVQVRRPHKGQRDVAFLHMFLRGADGKIGYSPFAIKLETFLRINNLPYVVVFDSFVSPQHRVTPWAEYDGVIYEDIDEAISAISTKTNADMDSHLTLEQKAVGRSLQAMLEHHLYWTILMDRWVYGKGCFVWNMVGVHGSWLSRLAVRRAIGTVQTKMEALTFSHGIGKKSQEQVSREGHMDVKAIEDYLGDKQFVLGDRLSRVDCCVFAFLYLCSECAGSTSLLIGSCDFHETFPKCSAYVTRIQSRYYPSSSDIFQACDTGRE